MIQSIINGFIYSENAWSQIVIVYICYIFITDTKESNTDYQEDRQIRSKS